MAPRRKARQPAGRSRFSRLAPGFVDCPNFIDSEGLVGFVRLRFERQIGFFWIEYGGLRARVQEARGLQFLIAGKVIQAGKAEMLEEKVGRAPGYRPAGARRRPIGLIQFCSNSRSSVPLLSPTPAHLLRSRSRVTGW